MTDYWLLTLIVLIVLVIINGIRSTLVTVAILLVAQYYIQSISPLTNEMNKLPKLDDEVSRYNESSLDSILSSTYQDADTSLSGSFIENGKKSKKAADIRSHLNNDSWKKYYDYEFATSGENRDWWSNDDSELSRRHDISAFY